MPAFTEDSNIRALSGRRILVLVQGPLEQSPRMAAHVHMLLEAGAAVNLQGYGAARDFPFTHERLAITALAGSGRNSSRPSSRLPLVGALRHMARMAGDLRGHLRHAVAGADLLFVQVPPVAPGVALAARAARRQGIPLVIDWHNLSHAMAALKLGPRHPAVAVLRGLESRTGRRASGHLAVTRAMADHLQARLDREVTVLRDRPSGLQQTASLADNAPPHEPEAGLQWRTLVSPTSWSLDEDMDLLLDALRQVTLPPGRGLHVMATGKGPGRADFEKRAAEFERHNLRIETAWLSHPAYLELLARADAGISLHRSASGLDFPMKIIDMEAACLPVLALDYGPALREGLDGLSGAATFTDAAGLARHLEQLLSNDRPRGRVESRADHWEAAWTRAALPLFQRLLS
ncbi:glycosyltransferase [Fodinicurvata halophila]|uniref:Glycosyltransferase n=1 Tax=Fodinicurvata halophila TaxID=1419723 RepID=A0ABV8UIR2_9PROT